MRFLKNKIALCAQNRAKQATVVKFEQMPEVKEEPKITLKQDRPRKTINHKTPKKETQSTKTVVKNYGKAIASFAITEVAIPYLTPFIIQHRVNLRDFVEYISKAKETIEGIDSFRGLLLPKHEDIPIIAAYKTVFRKIAEIFIKYFSVNWIFSGRMKNKRVHLDFRFKMLRRVSNPELFTYLK